MNKPGLASGRVRKYTGEAAVLPASPGASLDVGVRSSQTTWPGHVRPNQENYQLTHTILNKMVVVLRGFFVIVFLGVPSPPPPPGVRGSWHTAKVNP